MNDKKDANNTLNGYPIDDFKDMKVIIHTPTAKEREIVESWLVDTSNDAFDSWLTGILGPNGPKIPMAIRSRGKYGLLYENPDPSFLQATFVSDEKYKAFLKGLENKVYTLDAKDIHPFILSRVVDILYGRIKVLLDGVEILPPDAEEDKSNEKV